MEVKGNACGLGTQHRQAHHKEQTHGLLESTLIQTGWEFKQIGSKAVGSGRWLPVSQFPTNVHLDLAYHGLIPDPIISKNEEHVQWVGEQSWAYRTRFQSPSLRHGQKAVLAFDGLDTYATVFFNGKEKLNTKNMFIPERLDVTEQLNVFTENELEIDFDSTYLVGKKLVESDPEHKYGCWNGDPSRLAVRKAQYHYGWDWGPALLTCGPWRAIHLEIYTSRIADLFFTTEVDSSLAAAEIAAECEIEGYASEAKFEILFRGKPVASETVGVVDGFASAVFRTQKPELWYPARYGKQPLYELNAVLLAGTSVLDVKNRRFGLRRVEVVQRELQHAPGTTFFFQINNIPIFCGGSNWIPADMLIPSIEPSRYRSLLKLALEGNHSMVRIWGGGIFEEESFYNACDEFGILVWQDFLFACGNYPANDEFLGLVKREATANVKRLRHHPCIVIWAGNNEDYQYRETEHLDYDPQDRDPESWLKSNFPARYIYEKILLDVTRDLIPGTYYQFGSPFGGKSTRDATVGDIHQWNIWHGRQESYQDWDKLGGRFVSEFGMEAFPSNSTIDSYLPKGKDDSDRYAQSSTVDFHNKAAGHERRLATYLVENIPYSHEPFDYYVYCTQLMQAECLATAFRLWKRQWKGRSQEYCGGALVWQLNDCWPAQSWSIVDYNLQPKLAYYAIKRELADITINTKRVIEEIPADKYTRAYVKKIHKVQIFVTNLSLDYHQYSFRYQGWDISTGTQLFTEQKLHHKTPKYNQSTEICEHELGDSETASRMVFAAYLINPKDGRTVSRSISWPEPLKYVHFPPPENLRVDIIRGRDTGNAFEVECDVPIKGLVLEVENTERRDIVFEDNCVDLVPGEAIRITVTGLKAVDNPKITYRYLRAAIDL
ncbi:MAG: hypothetical protein Q9209_001150 [Squamulea sp. 1 TL-2023]